MGTLYLVVLKLGAKTGIHFRSPGPTSCSSGSPSTSSECWPPPHTSSTSSSSTPQQRGPQMPQGIWPINHQNTFLLIYRAIWLFPVLKLWYGILYKLLRIQQLTDSSQSFALWLRPDPCRLSQLSLVTASSVSELSGSVRKSFSLVK